MTEKNCGHRSDLEAAQSMDKIAKTIFAPVYPAIAENIVSRFGIAEGTCVDIGSGPAALSIALAKASKMKVFALDLNPFSGPIAQGNILAASVNDRVKSVLGSVDRMPFGNNFADLVVSRGSFFFWPDLEAAFNEIYRILKPGGQTYIGGGFGSPQIKRDVFAQMAKEYPEWEATRAERFSATKTDNLDKVLKRSIVPHHEFIRGEAEFWINFSK